MLRIPSPDVETRLRQTPSKLDRECARPQGASLRGEDPPPDMSNLTVRYATADEITRWDELVAGNPTGGDFVAVAAYGAVKETVGWKARHLVFERAGSRHSVGLVLERKIPLLGRYWYLPRTPAESEVGPFLESAAALRDFASGEAGVFAVTLEPPLLETPEIEAELDARAAELAAISLSRRHAGLQPHTSTTLLDVDRDDDALMASFSSSTRTKIRKAIREGNDVREYPATPETFAKMIRLQKLVGGGTANLRLRPDDYAARLWQAYSDAGLGKFYGIDGEDGEPAVMAFTIRVGENSFYKDGGSERPRTTPGMSYLLQWHMMRAMRDEGAKTYDMVGTPPASELENRDHVSYSVGQFKIRFNKHVTEYIGVFDLVLRPKQYQLWLSQGLRITRKLHMRKYNDLDLY